MAEKARDTSENNTVWDFFKTPTKVCCQWPCTNCLSWRSLEKES